MAPNFQSSTRGGLASGRHGLSPSSMAMACAGIAVTALLVGLDLRRAAELQEAVASQQVSEFAAAIHEQYNRSYAYQRAVNAHFLASNEVEDREFTRFLSIQAGPEAPFVALQYVPWVRAGDRARYDRILQEQFGVAHGMWQLDAGGDPRAADARPDYFPVLFIHPASPASLRGFDIGSEPARRRALELAASSGEAAASVPVRLMQRPHEWGFVVAAPLRRAADPCTSAEECRSATAAFTVGVYTIPDLLAEPLARLSADVAVFVFDDSRAGARPLYARPAHGQAATGTGPLRAELDAAGAQWRTFRVAQHEWQLALVTPGGPWISLQTAALLILGLGLTLAVVFGQERALKHIRALQESERQRETLFSNLPGFVYRVANEPSWPILFVSRGVLGVTGYRPEDFIAGTPVYGDLIVPQDRDAVWNEVQAAVAEGRRFQTEYRIVTADKQTRWVWEQGCAVHAENGELLFLEGFVTDITERRRTQEQLAQAEKQEAIGLLTGGLAHDFNNALGIVVGNLDLAAAKIGDDPKLRGYVDSALNAALRGASVTKSLLAVARRQTLEVREFDLNGAVREIMPLVQQTAGPRSSVVEALSEEPLIARADPGGLAHAILNLVINARDAMPDGGRLVVETGLRTIRAGQGASPMLAPGRYVVVAVRDTGTGMTPEVAARAFEPYFTTKERGKGTGLGLAMVHGYAQQSGGTATIHSRAGNGTVVRIYLPAGRLEAPASGEAPPASLASAHGERILIVDDEAEIAQVACEWLQSLGYAVEYVTEAAVALARLQDGKWDLLLTDIVMPGMDGFELARRAQGVNPGLRVLLCSGYSEKVAAMPSRELRLLEKPYRRHELARAVRELLDAPRPEGAQP